MRKLRLENLKISLSTFITVWNNLSTKANRRCAESKGEVVMESGGGFNLYTKKFLNTFFKGENRHSYFVSAHTPSTLLFFSEFPSFFFPEFFLIDWRQQFN